MKKLIKKIKYAASVFYWFVWYNLLHSETKKVWHLFASMLKHSFLGTPYAIIIETSNTCNFNCPTCPTPHKLIHQRRKPEFMPLERYKKIIDNIKDYVHIVYVYNSNEPLLHPDIIEMIKYASRHHLHTMLSTNCSALTKEKTEDLLASGLGEIRFAFDGLSKESFEGFRRGGNFEETKANVEYFMKRKKELGVKRPIATLQFILNKLNQGETESIKEFSKRAGIDKLYIKPFILSEYAYSKDEIKALSKKFFVDKDIDNDNIVYKKDDQGLKPRTEYAKCPDVNKVFTVLADGRAVMCCFDLFGDYVYGRMDKTGLKALWRGPQATALRRSGYDRKTPLCGKCGNIE